jgi:lysophospholipase L1-like esterase
MKNTCNNAEGSQNPEKQPALVVGKKPNGKSRLIAVFIGTFIGLLLCEVLVRIIAPQDLTGTWFENSPRGNSINKANWTARHQGGRRVVYYHLNDLHLRGGPIGTDTNRVLCVGDSFTFGWLLAEKDTFVCRLGGLAERDFPTEQFEFLNGGISAGGTADFVEFIEDYAPHIRPAAILVFLNNDDVERAMHSGLFRLDPNNSNQVTPVEQHYVVGKFREKMRHMAAYQWLLEHSELVELVRNALAKRIIAAHLKDVAASQTAADDELGVKLEQALFVRLRDWCDTNHCRLFVLTTGYNAFPDFPLGRNDGNANKNFFRKAPEFFSKSGIAFHDLGPEMFTATKGDFSKTIIPGDFHPNERGDELVANLAWPWLKEQLSSAK